MSLMTLVTNILGKSDAFKKQQKLIPLCKASVPQQKFK